MNTILLKKIASAVSCCSSLVSCYLLLLFTCHLSLVTHAYSETPQRIISLAPNMTEILFALDLGERIVGVTSFCDFPGEAKKKPKIGGMSNPSLEAVIALKPDIVVLTKDGNPKEFEERLRSLRIRTYVFKARRLNELPDGIRDLGTVLGAKEKADKLANEIETAISKVGSQKSEVKSENNKREDSKDSSLVTRHSSLKEKVLFIVWPEPLIVAGPGTVIDDAITIIGGENIASKARVNYPKYSIEEILRRAPDVIFIGRGKGMEKVSGGLLQRMKTVPAVKNGKVFYVSDYLYRLTPRTVKGIEELAGYLDR